MAKATAVAGRRGETKCGAGDERARGRQRRRRRSGAVRTGWREGRGHGSCSSGRRGRAGRRGRIAGEVRLRTRGRLRGAPRARRGAGVVEEHADRGGVGRGVPLRAGEKEMSGPHHGVVGSRQWGVRGGGRGRVDDGEASGVVSAMGSGEARRRARSQLDGGRGRVGARVGGVVQLG